MGIKESAKQYNDLGFSLVALQSGKKGPNTPNWHTQGVDVEKLDDSKNIGLIHGLSGTCSIDVDYIPDSIPIFRDVLGMDPVAMKSAYPCYRGRQDGIKFIFRLPTDIGPIGIKKLTYKDGNEITTVFELRGSTTGTGAMDILPPSKHPLGNLYKWVNPLPKTYEEIPLLPEVLIDLWQNWELYEPKMLNAIGRFTPDKPKRQYENKEDSADIIDLFNTSFTVTQILERNAYIKKGNDRFLSPHSSSKMPGIVLLEDGTIYSHHGGDQLGDGHSHDAFDVARILEANSDWKTAFNNARSDLGIEQVVYKKPIDVRAFKFFHASEAINNASAPKWVIKNVAEEDSLIGVFGSAKTGKSFVTVDMACCVATGKDWHEKKTNQGLVLYIAGEGINGLSRRMLAWEQVHKQSLKDSRLHYSQRGVQMLDDLDAEMMRNEALALQDIYKEAPKLVVIDTLARNFGPGNENSTEDMNRFVSNVDRFIREEFRCAVMIVHHVGHNEGGRGRGSSVLPAALDAEYRVTKNDDEMDRSHWSLDLEQTLIKDGRGISPMRFAFQETEFHHLVDEDGDPTTSGALVNVPYMAKVLDKPLGDTQEKVLRILKQLHMDKLAKEGMDKDVFVTQKELRDACGFDITKAKKRLIELGLIEEIETHKFTPKDDD
tara:strand:+ start:219 stop:2192 length:1974 start_codon:yes stop_codon:yes gene_type:complete